MHTIQLSTKQVEELIDGVAITLTDIETKLETAKGDSKAIMLRHWAFYFGLYDVLDKALQEVETTNEH
jgi:hypothetical protein